MLLVWTYVKAVWAAEQESGEHCILREDGAAAYSTASFASGLEEAVGNLEQVIVIVIVSKTVMPCLLPARQVFNLLGAV